MSLTVAMLLCLTQAPEPGKSGSYRLPFEEGKTFPLTQGNNGSTSHTGYCLYAFDFGLPEGTRVTAARGGKVVEAKSDIEKGGTGGGNQIKIDHGDGTFGMYFHLKFKGALVGVGETILQGDLIGLSGATGNVTGPHLHFQVDRGGKSIPISFQEVEGNGGVPQEGKSYTSRNTPGIPAETKDRLSVLFRSEKLAEDEGAWGVAWLLCRRIADERLKVNYLPQEEARRKIEELPRKADEAAQSQDLDLLFRARAAFEGVPAPQIARALEAAKDLPGYPEARSRASIWEEFFRGIKSEAEGHLSPARAHFRNVLASHPDEDLRKRTDARLAAVESRLRDPLTHKSPR